MADTTTEEKVDSTADLSEDSKKIIQQIEGMTVLELSKLVKALEDKFGVVAAAPVAVAAPAAGGDDQESSADKTFEVVITGVGDKKIQVLKVVREITGLGLKEAKEIVDTVPKGIKDGLSKEEAEEMKKKIEEQGATVELK